VTDSPYVSRDQQVAGSLGAEVTGAVGCLGRLGPGDFPGPSYPQSHHLAPAGSDDGAVPHPASSKPTQLSCGVLKSVSKIR